MKLRLKKEYLEKIKRDPRLYGEVAHALGVVTGSMLYLLRTNNVRFTQKNVLIVLSEYFDIPEEELVEEIKETENA